MIFEKQTGISLTVAGCIGALVLVITGVLTEKQAYKAIDSQTIFIFGGTLALAKALEMTGAGKLVADQVIGLLGNNSSPFMLLVVVFALSVVMTNFMSNTATVALLVPVSLSIAAGMGADPRAVLMATVIGSSCAYATPIGMPANMMVLSAGGYKFVDYAKSGIPLIIVSTIVSLILLPILFPFHP
ncbi:putative cation transporter [Klebsiella pneumoniae]|nr:putative cation transporter [Klebsiella pneumoniae]